ncbi:MAG TPA: hypothetical protein VIJ77_06185 [Candidatus Tumulicola sp.]
MKILVGFLAIALAVVTWAYFEKPLSSFTGPLASPSPQSPQGGPAQTDGNPVGFRLKFKSDMRQTGVKTSSAPIVVSAEGVPVNSSCLAKNTCHLEGIYFINADGTCTTTSSKACGYKPKCPHNDTCLHVDATSDPIWIDSYQSDGKHDHKQESIKGEVRIVLTK